MAARSTFWTHPRARTCEPCCRWSRRISRAGLLPALLTLTACVSVPGAPSPTESLLALSQQVIEAGTPEQRRALLDAERARFEAESSYDNLLRLALARAFGAALPSELQEVRADLQALANGRQELSDGQRRLALIALIMVDERLRLGGQISGLQRQIDSLTEIEASLNNSAGSGTGGQAP